MPDYPMRGTYVLGWRFNWEDAKKEYDALLEAGREERAAAIADPGIVSCPQCGHHHWREFEVFLCARCGAQVSIHYDSGKQLTHAGLPARPEAVPPRLKEGMRVAWLPERAERRGKPNHGNWKAGKVPPGTAGTVHKETEESSFDALFIDFDDLTPKDDGKFVVFGPFLEDDFLLLDGAREIVKEKAPGASVGQTKIIGSSIYSYAAVLPNAGSPLRDIVCEVAPTEARAWEKALIRLERKISETNP